LNRRRFLVECAATTAVVGLGLGCERGRIRRTGEVRRVAAVVPAVWSRDGAGVTLRRSLGHRGLPMLDPFLMLDEIRSSRPEDYAAGFPQHPHRGFETVSYLIAGAFEHRDSVGNHGLVGPGACQWMTAGRGIVHEEMPRQEPGKELWGLQLWVNLPAARKMTAPRYQELGAGDIPELDQGDARVRLVAGTLGRRRGPVDGVAVAPTMLDVAVPAGGLFRHEVPAGHNTFAYVLDGVAELGAPATRVEAGSIAVLEGGRDIAASSAGGARFLLLAAAPIGEPVARRGPFVMNTERELEQAFDDYRSGRLIGG
jgi:quercetin 2,3-dioxygenase